MSTSSAIPVTYSKRLPERNIQYESMRQHVYHWTGAVVRANSVGMIDGPCQGEYYGGLELISDGVLMKKCPCFQITQGDKGESVLV